MVFEIRAHSCQFLMQIVIFQVISMHNSLAMGYLWYIDVIYKRYNENLAKPASCNQNHWYWSILFGCYGDTMKLKWVHLMWNSCLNLSAIYPNHHKHKCLKYSPDTVKRCVKLALLPWYHKVKVLNSITHLMIHTIYIVFALCYTCICATNRGLLHFIHFPAFSRIPLLAQGQSHCGVK